MMKRISAKFYVKNGKRQVDIMLWGKDNGYITLSQTEVQRRMKMPKKN